jgi:hypothetical protein
MDATKSGPIELSFQSVKQVLVVADDGDRFFTTAREAARACKQADNDREFNEQFNSFLRRLHEWSLAHEKDVSALYVTVADSGLNVVACLESDEYKFDFEDSIVDLDIELAEKFPLCPAEVMQVPKQDSIISDLPAEALVVYDKGRRPQGTGKS